MADGDRNISFTNTGGGPNYYQHALARAQNQDSMNQIRQVAEMGAQQLAQYGPDGEAWAKRLRDNPAAAMAHMNSLGGPRAIENQLRMGNAVADSGRQMDPVEYDILVNRGPEALSQYQLAAANESLARSRNVESDMLEQFMGNADAQEGGGYGAGGAFDFGDPQLNAIAGLSMINPELSNSLRNVREASRKPLARIAQNATAMAKPAIKDLAKHTEQYGFIHNVDYNNPSNDASLVKMFVQMVEPGLMVTPREGEVVIEAAEPMVGAWSQRILRTVTRAGRFTPETRRLMVQAIDQGMAARSREKIEWIGALREDVAQNYRAAGLSPQEALEWTNQSFVGDQATISRLQNYLDNPINLTGPEFTTGISGHDVPPEGAQDWMSVPAEDVPIGATQEFEVKGRLGRKEKVLATWDGNSWNYGDEE